ncbi:PREDICTED: 28S ribosomal protein S6, mitochondrial [Leptosomus discolor]|uniref:28S ribosomal protein S6, mitochondrial n=1 Tax=Leptosomus discolor TaxID=188344 RepID=UPI000522DF49|nr:PREDICTED: 28S ribosomal protein S6, mitochondrial [Leptosomus discolor]
MRRRLCIKQLSAHLDDDYAKLKDRYCRLTGQVDLGMYLDAKCCKEYRRKLYSLPETAAVLKRTVEALMERGAVVRNLENLGERSLPYKISKHKERHRRGGYFLIDLEGPPSIVSTMMDHLGRDIDVIRRAFVKHPVSKTEECSGIIPVNYEDKLMAKRK